MLVYLDAFPLMTCLHLKGWVRGCHSVPGDTSAVSERERGGGFRVGVPMRANSQQEHPCSQMQQELFAFDLECSQCG